MSPKPVLVLDGNQRSALAATRSLGKHGIPVITASESASAICRHSKYSVSHLVYPDPKNKAYKFSSWLDNYLQSETVGVVFPMTDITCNILAQKVPSIGNTIIPIAKSNTVSTLSDKAALTKLATELNIPCPNSIHVESIEQIENLKGKLTFPCVVKPSFSKILVDGAWQSAAVTIVSTPKQLDKLIATENYLKHQPFMIQEYIDGTGQGVFALYSQGKDIAWFAHKRVREKPPWGGVSVLSESVAEPEAMIAISKKLLDHKSWHGVAMVEFKVTSDGTPYLIEVNTRFWGSLQLAVDAGIDFPYLLYQVAIGREPKQQSGYEVGKRLRWLLGDIDGLMLTLRSKELSTTAKLACAKNFFIPDFKNTKHEVFRFDDFRPALYEIKEYVATLINGT